jgi:hypothetical protein
MITFLFPFRLNNLIFDYTYADNKAYLSYYTFENQFCNTRFIFQRNDEQLGIIVNIEFYLGLLEILGGLTGILKDIPLKEIQEKDFKYKINIESTCGVSPDLTKLSSNTFYFERKNNSDDTLYYVYATNDNLSFHFFEDDNQKGALSPDPNNTDTILNIPYQTGWNGERYLLSTYDETSNTYTPFKLQNIKNISFTVDLSNSTFNSSDNCNFNCYLVASTSSSNPNSSLPPINNTKYVSTPNYYDSAAADGGRYGVEFDIFETNSGNNNDSKINFNQHTGHFYTPLLNGSATQSGPSEITFSSSTSFNTDPTDTSAGAPDTNFRTVFNSNNNIIDINVNFSNPSTTDETTISYNNTVVWNSKWIVGGTWDQWTTATQPEPKEDFPYPCSTIGTLIPFNDVVQTNNNADLFLKTINDANITGYWLIFGMSPYYTPPTNSYQGNHSGVNGSNGAGGNILIKDFTYTFW